MKWDAVSNFCLAALAALEFGFKSARAFADEAIAVCERFSEMVLSRPLRKASPVMFLVFSSSIFRRTF